MTFLLYCMGYYLIFFILDMSVYLYIHILFIYINILSKIYNILYYYMLYILYIVNDT